MAAKTKAQVQAQSTKERLWDELDFAYGQKKAESNKAYDKNYSQTGQQLQKAGMQRSSYGAQTKANVLNEKAEAEGKIASEQMAAYQQGLDTLEQREADERYRNAQLAVQSAQIAENARQFDANLAYQKERSALEDAFREKQYSDTRSDTAWSQQYQEKQLDQNQGQFDVKTKYDYDVLAQNKDMATAEMDQNATQFDKNLQLNRDKMEQDKEITLAQMAQSADQFNKNLRLSYDQLVQNKDLTLAQMAQQLNLSEKELAQSKELTLAQLAQNKDLTLAQLAQQLNLSEKELAQNKELTLAQLAQNKELTYAQLNQNQTQFDITQAFNERQLDLQQDRWKQEFDYQQKTDDQKIAMEYTMAVIQNGGSPSNELLQRAGLSRADANAMTKQTQNSGGTYTGNPKATSTPPPTTPTDDGVKGELDEGAPPATTTSNTKNSLSTLEKLNQTVKKTTNPLARRINANK